MVEVEVALNRSQFYDEAGGAAEEDERCRRGRCILESVSDDGKNSITLKLLQKFEIFVT